MGRGPDDYLVKPFAARELLARVNANIQLAAARQEAACSVRRSERLTLMTQERLSLALSTTRVSVFEWDVEPNNVVVHGPFVEAFGMSADGLARAFEPFCTTKDVDRGSGLNLSMA